LTTAPQARRAWVTGAGKGIGRALVLRLAAEGWQVAASARTEADLESLVREAAGSTGSVQAYPLDVTGTEKTKACVARIEDTLGALDMAVLNAGTHIPVGPDDFSAAPFRTLMDVNFFGVVHGLEHVLPRFIGRKRGHVVVVSSIAGYRGLPTAAAYGASKAALINMCEALKPELDARGIRLTLVNPGFVKTPLTDANEFPMPFLIPVEDAVDRIMAGLQRSKFEIAFPRPFALIMKTLRMLPYGPFFRITRRMIDK
jgi:NAD(P)-dependent dehydrogenase (short-subunit alcohol dehydrogenase family)